jgi:nucleoside-diphosphate-sugar epimerase
MTLADTQIRRAVVTGASGFVGRRLCAELESDGIEVTAVHRHACTGPWTHEVVVDLSGNLDVAHWLQDVDVVFHLAGNAHATDTPVSAEVHHLATVVATRHLLASCAQHGVSRLVFASTVKAVADPGTTCIDETFSAAPTTAYGLAKRAAEDDIFQWAQVAGRHAVVLRPTLLLGAGVKGNFRRLLDAVRRGRFPPLPDWQNHRSVLHVDDFVLALRLAAVHPAMAGERLFVCFPTPYSTRDMVNAVRAAIGRPDVSFQIPEMMWYVVAGVGDVLGSLTGRRAPFDHEHLARLKESAQYDSARLEMLTGFVATKGLDAAVIDLLKESN